MADKNKFTLPKSLEQTLSPNEAAEMLGITGEAVKQWLYGRKLPGVKLANGYWRIRCSDLTRFLEMRASPTQQKIVAIVADRKSTETIDSVARACGHEVICTSNCLDTLLKVQDLRPALLIVDLTLPKTAAMIERLRSLKKAHLPALLFIAASDLNDAVPEWILDVGGKGVLVKPVDPALLRQELEHILLGGGLVERVR